jgi:RNA polymerase sigma-70 factor (ECF subfamily)
MSPARPRRRDGAGAEDEAPTPAVAPHLRSVDRIAYANWEAIYLDNVERLYRLMYSRVGNRAEAEDLTAEVFQAALGPLEVSASVGEVRAYLLATARTVLASHWRRRYGAEVSSIDVIADLPKFDDPPSESDAPRRVAAIIEALPPRYRQILELRFLQSCSIREAAESMNVSPGNAKVLQHRALRHAAALFEGER